MKPILPILFLDTLLAQPASAHVLPGQQDSFLHGLTHPFLGMDHVLAMVAVGLWAAVQGGRALWALPLGFVGGMIAGFCFALVGTQLPLVEPMILASVIVLGLCVTVSLKLPLSASVGIVAVLGLFHGHAHGAEMGTSGVLTFGLGFALATAMLHTIGVAFARGVLLRAPALGSKIIAGLGGMTTLWGLALAFG